MTLTKGTATTNTLKPGSTTSRADITTPAPADSSMQIPLLPQGRTSWVTICLHIVIIALFFRTILVDISLCLAQLSAELLLPFVTLWGGNRPDSEDFSLVELCGEVLMGFFSGGVENSIVGLGVNVFIAIYDFASAYEDAQINPNAWFGYGSSVFISLLNLDVFELVFKTSFDDAAKAAFDYTFGVGLQMCDTVIGVIIETFTEKDNSITERMPEQSENQPGETTSSSTTSGSSGGTYQVVSNNRFYCSM